MKISEILNLSFIPHNRRGLIYPAAALGALLLFAGVFSVISGITADTEKTIQDLSKRRERIIPMVEELRSLQQQGGSSLRPMEPLAAAQQIARDLKIEANLASIRPMNMVGDQEAVQVFFESLNLDQLMGLLISLESRAGLQVFSFNLNRRMDDPKLANLQMVLTR